MRGEFRPASTIFLFQVAFITHLNHLKPCSRELAELPHEKTTTPRYPAART